MKVKTIVFRYTGEVIYGSSTVPSLSGSSFTPSVPKKISKEYEKLAGRLKGKERTAVMVERFGGGEAWDSFETKLALKIESSGFWKRATSCCLY